MRRCKQCRAVELLAAAKCTGIIEKKGYCSIECLAQHSRERRIKADAKKTAQRRKADVERIKSLSEICSDVQRDVNAMIRAADIAAGHTCIATGAPISDCGHFYHAGSKYRISWLRFHHANLHGQGAKSNRYAGGGDALNYLNGLRARYGQRYIDELEDFKRCEDSGLFPAPTRDELRAMQRWARAMIKIYKNN
jgi:hypothetical protein